MPAVVDQILDNPEALRVPPVVYATYARVVLDGRTTPARIREAQRSIDFLEALVLHQAAMAMQARELGFS